MPSPDFLRPTVQYANVQVFLPFEYIAHHKIHEKRSINDVIPIKQWKCLTERELFLYNVI